MCSLTTEARRSCASADTHHNARSALAGSVRLAVLLATVAIGGCAPAPGPSDASGGADAALGDANAPRDTDGGDADAALSSGREDASGPLDAGVGPDASGADAGSAHTSLIEGGHDVLFVGNSYVYVGDVPGRYRTSAEALGPLPVRLESVAPGGYRLAQHAADALADGTALARWLRTGTAGETDFDVVILQEQSQIGGFPEGEPLRMQSLDGASGLGSLARAQGVAVVLYLTWGRERGDETNPGLYPTFSAMQDRLDAGYRAMAARLRSEGSMVRIAPVGGAFRMVHDELVTAGMDPTAEGSEFDALYDSDGSHPSARGAYLAAAVIFGAITGADPRGLPDGADLDAASAGALREVAATVLEDPRWESELR